MERISNGKRKTLLNISGEPNKTDDVNITLDEDGIIYISSPWNDVGSTTYSIELEKLKKAIKALEAGLSAS